MAAGNLIEPPVSLPIASGARWPAIAELEPPPEPPGILLRSQGFLLGPYAENSVEDPIANSSRLVFPRIGIEASLSFLTTVASY